MYQHVFSTTPFEPYLPIFAQLTQNPMIPTAVLRRDMRGISILFSAGAEINHIGLVIAPNDDDTQLRGQGLVTRELQNTNIDTAICTWYNPSKVAWLHYVNPICARNACERLTIKIRDRMIKAEIVAPDLRHEYPNQLWTVRLANLHPDTENGEILSHLKRSPPHNVLFSPATIDKTEDETIEAVHAGLNDHGRQIRSFEVATLPWKGQIRAFVTFTKPSDLESTRRLNDKYITSIGSKFFVDRKATARLSIPSTLYNAVKADITVLKFDDPGPELDRVRITTAASRTSQVLSIWIVGSTALSVTKAKIQVQSLTRGSVMLNHRGGPLWDEFYASDAGLAELQTHNKPELLFLYRDLQARRILAYGRMEQIVSARHGLMDGIRLRARNLHLIHLEDDLTREAKEYGLLHLRNKFGQPCVPNSDGEKDCCVPLNGSNRDADYAQQLFDELAAGRLLNPTNRLRRHECPICLDPIKDAIRLSCGHQLCRACFEAQCQVADSHGLPIRCFGKLNTCRKPVSIQDFCKYLPSGSLDHLLEASLDVHLRNHSDRFQQCVTTDCPNIFPVTDAPTSHVCPQCLACICTRCKTLSHEGLVCQENKRLVSEQQQHESVRDVPRMATQIADLIGGRLLSTKP